MKTRLKWYLSAAQVGLALSLASWGSIQTQRLLQQRGTEHIWSYVSPAEMAMHTLNAPVAVLCAATLSQSFQIGIEYSRGIFLIYIILVAALWFSTGWCIWDYQKLRTQRPSLGRRLRVVGVVAGVLLLLVGIGMLPGPWSMFFSLATILWGAVFIVLFNRRAGPVSF